MQPHGPVARRRNLVVLQVQELVRRHVVGHDILAVGLHHHREYDAVEHDVVLADEVHQPGVFVLPPLFPRTPLLGLLGAQLNGVRHIADGRVEPHIQHFSFCTLDGYGNTPVQVARHGTGLQIHLQPRLTLAVDVGAPLLVTLQNPLLQPLLIFVQGQIPVLRLFQHGGRAADGRLRVDELRRTQVAAALLTLVAVCTLSVAVGTFARHVAVCQELLGLFVVQLFGGLFHQLAFVVQLAEPLGGKLVVRLRGCAAVDVERDTELLERVLDHLVVAVYHVLRGDALLSGTHRDGHTVLVRAADKHHVLLLQTQVTHIDICRHINASQVTDVYTAIGIGQGRGHRCSLKLLLYHFSNIFLFRLQR